MNAYDEVLRDLNPAVKPARRKTVRPPKTPRVASSVATTSRKRGRPAREEAHPRAASPGANNSVDHIPRVTLTSSVSGIESSVDHLNVENPNGSVDAALLHICLGWRMRTRWHKAEKALILQGKAFCRGYCDGDKEKANALFDAAFKAYAKAAEGEESETADISFEASVALEPFFASLKKFRDEREKLEKDLNKTARSLPTYEWSQAIPGFAEGGFLSIIGEATVVELDGTIRAIGDYHTVAGLWKRMGVAIINGERQRKRADAEEALLHGYNPARRSALWTIGNGLIGHMGLGYRPSPGEDVEANESLPHYRKMFVARCRYLAAREPEKFGRPNSSKKNKKTEEVEIRESYSLACAASAKRYVEKKFLRDLYARWRFETRGEVVDPETAWMGRLPLAAE